MARGLHADLGIACCGYMESMLAWLVSMTLAKDNTMFTFIEWLYSGRMNRMQYLVAKVVLGLATTMLVFLLRFLGETVFNYGVYVFGAIAVFYHLAFDTRRLHDIGYTGFVALLLFVPVVNVLYLLYLLFGLGQDKVNEYGKPQQSFSFKNAFLGVGNPEPFVNHETGERLAPDNS